jgi:hypothetical protein
MNDPINFEDAERLGECTWDVETPVEFANAWEEYIGAFNDE